MLDGPLAGAPPILVHVADTNDGREAAVLLAGRADELARVSGRQRWRDLLRWISRGRLGRRRGWPVVPRLNAPWQDTVSPERAGWRQRAANLDGEFAFAVDYVLCRRCNLGWVESPYTLPEYTRCGLAGAGLAAIRANHPRLAWHTLGGHFRDSIPFWAAVSVNVPGGYQQMQLCLHLKGL
ncbi:hypothetical protein GCM10027176_18710 [Actinoallomurus bryophytorum]